MSKKDKSNPPKKHAQPAPPTPYKIHKPDTSAESADDISIRSASAPSAHNYPGKPFA